VVVYPVLGLSGWLFLWFKFGIDIWDAYSVAKAFKPRPTRSRRTATTDLSCRFRGRSH
jgi:hypothetical protein